jgi:TolB protein
VAALGSFLAIVSGAAQQPAQTPAEPARIVIGGEATRFAVPSCVPRKGDEPSVEACKTITQVLRNDLAFEGLFQFVPENLFSAIPALNPDAVNLEDWKGIGANILVVTRVEVTGGELALEAKVYAVSSGQNILAKRYTGKSDNPRMFAHQASDDIMTLTQYKGVARSKIAFVSDRTATKDKRSKEIFITDYDGYNPRQVTVNGSLNITPAWSPDGRQLAYSSYRQPPPAIFIASIFEGKSAKVTSDKGQAFGPAYSPDGKRIAYSSSQSGNMEIYVANADGSGARKITTTAASDTAPCWSPTGQEIAFTSDRAGTPQIYLMDSDGLNVRRLTTVGNWNDAPVWNPSKQYSEIAYTARLEAGGFDIAIIDLASHQVRQITTGRGSCESPSWAPNGRHLVFSCRRGVTWQIAVGDRDGRMFETLPAGPGNNTQPDWGS